MPKENATASKPSAKLSRLLERISKIAVVIGFLLLIAAIWGIEMGVLDLPLAASRFQQRLW